MNATDATDAPIAPDVVNDMDATDRASFNATSWLVFLGLLLVVFALYLPTLRDALVFDDAFITSGQLAAEYGSLSALKPRLLSYGTIVWVQALVGEAWWVQRLVNVLLHVAVVAMIYVFYAQLLTSLALTEPARESSRVSLRWRSGWGLFIGVAWFALNPTAVYAVAYLTQRSIVMATLFSVIALWAVLKALATRQIAYWLAATLAYIAAMLSKEYALALPAVAFAMIVVVRRPSAKPSVAAGVLVLVLAAVAAVAAGLLYARYSGIVGRAFDEISVSYLKQLAVTTPGIEKQAYPLSIINQMWLYFEYGCRWFLPSTQMMAVDLRPPFPTQLLSVPHVLGVVGYVALFVGSVTLMGRYRDGRALLGFCLFIPTMLFVTEFSTVWIQDPFVLYRSYLWAIAVPGLIYLGVRQLAGRFSSTGILACAGVIGLVLIWQTTDRVASFKTELTVWDDAVRKLPPELVLGKSRAYLNRGQAYQLAGEDSRAIRDYQRSTAFGDNGEGLLNAGSVLLARGRFAEAIAAFDGAMARGQQGASLSLNRGTALLSLGDTTGALAALQLALTQSPAPQEIAAVRRQRAQIFLQTGRIDEAITDAQFAAPVFAGDWQVRNTLGFALLAKGDRGGAVAAFNDSLQRGQSAVAFFGLARVFAEEQRLPEARTQIEKALALDPTNAQFQQLQGRLR